MDRDPMDSVAHPLRRKMVRNSDLPLSDRFDKEQNIEDCELDRSNFASKVQTPFFSKSNRKKAQT
jgi:hypothetical protein